MSNCDWLIPRIKNNLYLFFNLAEKPIIDWVYFTNEKQMILIIYIIEIIILSLLTIFNNKITIINI